VRLPKDESDDIGLNLTSMIDVVFLLLIFFLVATRLEEEEKLVSINLAEVLKAQPVAMGAQEIIVNITKEGRFNLYGEDCDERQLVSLLHEAALKNPGNQRVQIRADQDVPFKFPLAVIGICKQEQMEYSCTVLETGSMQVTAAH
jgi:biopolymer transport protein ExbD